MSLNSFLTDIANAIRNKKGTTDKIKVSNFASEINALPVASSTSGCAWNVISYYSDDKNDVFTKESCYMKTKSNIKFYAYDESDNVVGIISYEISYFDKETKKVYEYNVYTTPSKVEKTPIYKTYDNVVKVKACGTSNSSRGIGIFMFTTRNDITYDETTKELK